MLLRFVYSILGFVFFSYSQQEVLRDNEDRIAGEPRLSLVCFMLSFSCSHCLL